MPGQFQAIAELARNTPEIVECHRIPGEDGFIMKVLVGRVELLEGVLDEILKFGNTKFHRVVDARSAALAPPLPDASVR